MASLVTIAAYHGLPEALVAKGLLEAHGFVVGLAEWNHSSTAWHHLYALGGVRLWTIDTMENDARTLLSAASDAETASRGGRIAIVDLFAATVALGVAGLPLPLWKRRDGGLQKDAQ